MSFDFDWSRLSVPDALRLLIFDAELRRVPRSFIDALWAGVDALESSTQTMPTPGDNLRK